MSWEELYPVVHETAYYAIMRYDPKRKDKMQELISMAYIKLSLSKTSSASKTYKFF
jgi:hypothetical protein